MDTKKQRSIHRPISLTVETVSPLATTREYPPEVEVPLDLKGDRVRGEALIAEIKRQLEITDDFWAVSIITRGK